nr:peptidyl prolyl cis trans isomerase 3 [Echinococcus granulosus]
MQAPLAYSTLSPSPNYILSSLMNLNSYLECARRCICLTVAPASLPRVLTLFQEASANLENAYYWQKGGGLLLLQSRSQIALHKALRQIRVVPRAYLPILTTDGSTERFNLPYYRVCSDPSIWPVSSTSEECDENLVRFQPAPPSPSALEKLLLQQDSILGQMQKLVDCTTLCHSFRLALFTFSDSLSEILSTIRPGSSVYPFGSVINGLGSNSSDLDAVVNLGLEVPSRLRSFAQFCSTSVANLHQHPSTSGLSIMYGLLNYNGQTNYHTLTPVRYLLKRLDPLSGSNSRVLPGRTPIINYARHKCLGVGVDISRSSGDFDTTRLVLHAAYWMRALVTQVPAFLYLASALKFLMRGVRITHHGPSFGFTNYKLTSLLVSFLQVAVEQAPALEYLLLQDDCSIPEQIFIYEEHPHCPVEAPDLLLQFFAFLRAQQPEKSTFCLRSGRILPREGQTSQGHFLHCPNPLVPEQNITHGISAEAWRELLDAIDYMEHVLLQPRPQSGNFLALCASDYYKGCIFHRNIKGFIVQTGDPTGTGKNGQSIWKQKFKDEFDDALKHNSRGIVSMANNGPDSNGSQFFITYSKQTMLDMKYSIFGKVIDGWDVLDELERAPVEDKTYKPLTDIHIQDITIHANPFAE